MPSAGPSVSLNQTIAIISLRNNLKVQMKFKIFPNSDKPENVCQSYSVTGLAIMSVAVYGTQGGDAAAAVLTSGGETLHIVVPPRRQGRCSTSTAALHYRNITRKSMQKINNVRWTY